MMMRKLIILIIFFPAAFLFSEEPIKIGTTRSLTGALSEQSEQLYCAYQLWIQQVNARGGMLGRTVELISYDDESDPVVAAALYTRLIEEDHVDLVFAPYSTALTMSVSEVTESFGYPLIACGAAGEMVWSRGFRYIFGMVASSKSYFVGYLDLIAQEGYECLVILYEETQANIDATKGIAEWAGRFGLSVCGAFVISSRDIDLERIILQVRDINPDGLIICSNSPLGYKVLEDMGKLDYRPTSLAMITLPTHPDFYSRAGSMAEHVFAPSHWEPMERIPFPGTRRFLSDFRNFTGFDPSYHAAVAYGACTLVESAVLTVGSLDHEEIRNYLSHLDTVTIIGRYKVDSTGMQIGHNLMTIQWQNGMKEIVYPNKMHTADPVF